LKHSKYTYIKTLVEANMPVLLTGIAGCGKSTIAMQIAEELGTGFSSVSCTKQMSVSALLGFISITGNYITTQFREAYTEGKVFLLDEIDAADANVLLTLNTIENGFISFPDGIIKAHPNFRLIATANPFNEHASYTGRSKLDFSTIDRYFVIELERDDSLEIYLTSLELFNEVTIARQIMVDTGLSRTVTMRDSIRMHKLKTLGISECAFKDVVFTQHQELYAEFIKARTIMGQEAIKASRTQSNCITTTELWETIIGENK